MYISKRKLTVDFTRRAVFVAVTAQVALFLAIFFVYWNAQVVKNDHYTRLAVKNMTRIIDLRAPRGLIFDRNGRVLSENKINFSLSLIRENITDVDRTAQQAAIFSGKSEAQIRKLISRSHRYAGSDEIPIKTNLPLSSVIYIQSREDEFPEFKINVESIRTYPNGNSACHVLGYISEISDEELSAQETNGYRLGDTIGRSGVEKEYDTVLRGIKGSQEVIKDNLEKIQKVMKVNRPEIGDSLVLTIDLELQKFAEQLLQGEKGAIGMVDLRTGGMLAMVSTPQFNPELFSTTLEAEEWNALITDPEKPLQNKLIQGLYAPGSTFKVVMALAGLQENAINTQSTVVCTGGLTVYDRQFHCWNSGGHGTMDIFDALKNSCNIFFYTLGKKLDVDVIARYARMLGLGTRVDLDLPHEKEGLIPDTAWKRAKGQKWYPGETISVAIGQGNIQVSPLQILNMISTVALRGRTPRLHLLQSIQRNGRVVREYQPEFSRVPIAPENFEIVVEGLFRVVNAGGTGRAAGIPGYDICGKTGTSQVLTKENPNYSTLVKEKRYRPHSWFTAFAPRDNPQVALVVLVENGGDGGATAAPIARQIFQKYFENERPSKVF